MNRRRGRISGSLIGFLALAAIPTLVIATESGGTARALGVDTVMAGVMPPPGTRLNTFIFYYDADRTLDSSGHDRAAFSNFNLQATGVAFRLSHVWQDVKLWGADVETRVALGPVRLNLRFDVQTPAGRIHRESKATGLGDPLIAPVVLGWHGARYHQMAGAYLYIPIGNFDAQRLANMSRGYYTVAPVYWFSWFPTDKVEFSGNLIYLYNWENRRTGYRSGNEAGLDFGLGYAATDAIQIGLSGFLYKQLTDDRLNGAVVGDGNRGQAAGVGPFIRYHPDPDWGITFKWQRDMQVENKTEGDRFILQVMYKLR